jgi:hypothetical protein
MLVVGVVAVDTALQVMELRVLVVLEAEVLEERKLEERLQLLVLLIQVEAVVVEQGMTMVLPEAQAGQV